MVGTVPVFLLAFTPILIIIYLLACFCGKYGTCFLTVFVIMLQVSWDKKSIQDHVLDSHFLDLEGYARLYVVPLLGIRKSRPVKKDQSRPVTNGGQEQTRPLPATQATCHTSPSARVDAVLYACPLAVGCPARFRIEVIDFFPFCRKCFLVFFICKFFSFLIQNR